MTTRAAPTLEVFFARQTAGTGITSHTDDVNFIQVRLAQQAAAATVIDTYC